MPTTLELPRVASLTSMNHAITSEDVKMKYVDLRNFSSWEQVNGCKKGDENCKTERKILKVPYIYIVHYEVVWLPRLVLHDFLYLVPSFNQARYFMVIKY